MHTKEVRLVSSSEANIRKLARKIASRESIRVNPDMLDQFLAQRLATAKRFNGSSKRVRLKQVVGWVREYDYDFNRVTDLYRSYIDGQKKKHAAHVLYQDERN